MKKKTTKEHIIDIHMNTAAMSLAALITVFHLQMEVSHDKHPVVLNNTHVLTDPAEGSNLFEREREIHPTHGSYGARARYATVTGG